MHLHLHDCHVVESGAAREPSATVHHRLEAAAAAKSTKLERPPEETLKQSLSDSAKTAVGSKYSTEPHLQGSKHGEVLN